MKHTHQNIEIVKEYRKQGPTQVLAAFCDECGYIFLDLMGKLQDHEDESYELNGGSGVLIFDPNLDYVRETKHHHSVELEEAGLMLKAGKRD